MPSWLEGTPFAITLSVLFAIVFLRAQATYWIGRGVNAGVMHTRMAAKLSGPRTTRAIDALNKWGAPVITVSFLTIGFQTVANAAAGLIRMPWIRYTLAMVIGCAAWAAIYATVGFAAVEGALALAAHSPWALALVMLLLAALAVAAVIGWRRHNRRVVTEPVPTPAQDAELR